MIFHKVFFSARCDVLMDIVVVSMAIILPLLWFFGKKSETRAQLQASQKNSVNDVHHLIQLQYELIAKFPYRFTSDEVLFQVYAKKQDLTESEFEEARKIFYSKGQPCLRTSPLAKSYGFGIHHDEIGRIALFGMETAEYQSFLNDNRIKKVKAMRSSRK